MSKYDEYTMGGYSDDNSHVEGTHINVREQDSYSHKIFRIGDAVMRLDYRDGNWVVDMLVPEGSPASIEEFDDWADANAAWEAIQQKGLDHG